MKSRAKLQQEITDRQNELRGLDVLNFLKSAYTATERMSAGSIYVFDVVKHESGASYTVRFQFIRLSFFGYPNQYKPLGCNCPRYADRGDCNHILVAYAAHAESIKREVCIDNFSKFQLSKINEQKLRRSAA